MSERSARIVVATIGSLGDLHPYMAVALGLQERGYRVAIATSGLHRARIEAAGIEFRHMRPDAPDDPDLFRKVLDARRGTEFIFRDLLMGTLPESFRDLQAATRDADLLLSGPTAVGAPLVAACSGIAWASSVLQPSILFSTYDPPVPPQWPALSRLRALGRPYGVLLRLLARVGTRGWMAPYHRMRRELGLPPGANPLLVDQHSPERVLAMFSAVLAAPQPDWPRHVCQTGFAFYDRADEGRTAPPQLQRFLADGPPPVVFTLGSTAVRDAGPFCDESIAAARSIGRRALLLVGENAARLPAPLPPGVAAFDYAPYAPVFARAAAIVHQGGVGTLAQALRAGRPQLIVPFAHDQPDNAARAARLGVARVLARSRYRSSAVAGALSALLADRRAAERARELRRRVSAEEGARAACDALEELLAHRPRARAVP